MASLAHERLTTGVPGLDRVLTGGLLKGNMYVVTGGPGTGKTVLSAQLAFHRAALGEHVVYVSTFSESHNRLLSNLQSFRFFDESMLGSRITLQSAIPTLEAGGTEALLASIRELVRKRPISVLIIDSLLTVSECAPSGYEFRRFLRELTTVTAMNGCTAVLIAPTVEGRPPLEQYICDGILELTFEIVGMREVREVKLQKFRGSRHLGGRHTLEIDEPGLVVYPRLESLPLPNEPVVPRADPATLLRFGIAGLDGMLSGGLPPCSVTALMGAPGSGKTLLGMHFLAQALQRGEPAVYFGFYEQPERLLTKVAAVGLDLSAHARSGLLVCHWEQPVEQLLDALAQRLLQLVEVRRPTRLFLDGVEGMLLGAAHPDRIAMHFAALMNHLRNLGVTAITSMETSFQGPTHHLTEIELSASVENIVYLRYVEVRSRLHRLLSILKVRERGYDPSVREFRITPNGFEVSESGSSAEAILAAANHPREEPGISPAPPRWPDERGK